MSISDDFSFFILGIGGILVRKKKQLKISIFPRLRRQGFLYRQFMTVRQIGQKRSLIVSYITGEEQEFSDDRYSDL